MVTWFVKFIREMLHVLFGLARITCRKPRLTPGVSAMMPAVAREPLEHVVCERWKFHDGAHESQMLPPTGKPYVERW